MHSSTIPRLINIPQTTTMIQNDTPLRLSSTSFHNHGHAWWHHALFLLLLLLIQAPPPATSQLQEPPIEPTNNKSTVAIMCIVAVMFLISGFLSLYSRQCAGHRGRVRARLNLAIATATGNPSRRSHNESLGLNQETIDTFPTFLYSSVKGLKIGTCTLACAVCLSEFQDEETLRLIPKCSHVFHPSCIDVWLASHSTCPVCRADLVPGENDVVSPVLSIQIPDDDINQVEQRPNEEEENVVVVEGSGGDGENDVESSKDGLLRRSRTVNHVIGPTRSRSTGFLCTMLFPRSNSTGNLVQRGDEDFERFTLRLPDEFRSQVLMNSSTLKRAKSCVGFARMSSGTKGYRTRSVGGGRSYLQWERFGGDYEQWGFTLTPPFFTWNWNRLGRKPLVQCSVAALDNNAGERSSDFLRPV